jgi:hypothetical protein
MDLDSGKFYAKVLLKEPLPLLMQQSIEVFARGTGAAEAVMWPDKENRMNKRAAGHPPEAYIAYPTEADRQAALDENQQRPGEWGFYAAAARSGKDEKGRKSARTEGETREPFTELQPPNMERSGLLGDVPTQPATWAYEGEMTENWNQEAGWSPEPWSAHDFQWPEFRDREPEIDFFVDSPNEQRPTSNETWPSAALVTSLPALPAAEELVRPFDSTTGSALDLEEAEYRKMVLCLPECLMDNGEDSSDEYKGVNATPVRGQRLSIDPSTPGSAAAVALWRPINNGLPCQNTFIHFQDRMQSLETSGSFRRSKSCPVEAEELEDPERHVFTRAKTFDFTPSPAKLPPAEELPDFGSPRRGTTRNSRAVGLREKNMRNALETPVRRESGHSEDEPTPAPKTNPRHMRRGTRGRGSSSKDKNNKMQWRPTLWKENGDQH